MKSIKKEVQQFTASVMTGMLLLGTVFSGNVVTAFADEDLPQVTNVPTFGVDYVDIGDLDSFSSVVDFSNRYKPDARADGNWDKMDLETMGGQMKRTVVDETVLSPSDLLITVDNDAFSGTERDAANISSAELEIGNDVYNIDSFAYVGSLNLFMVNLDNIFSALYDSIPSAYIYYRAKSFESTYNPNPLLRAMTREGYFSVVDYINSLPSEMTVNLKYGDGAVLEVPVTFRATSRHGGRVYHASNNALVVTLPDSKHLTDETFYEIDNAIKFVGDSTTLSNSYYVDIDSQDDLTIPLDGMPTGSLLSNVNIGPLSVYNTSTAVDMSSFRTDISTGDKEIGEVYRFSIPTSDGGSINGFATENNLTPLLRALDVAMPNDGTGAITNKFFGLSYPIGNSENVQYSESMEEAQGHSSDSSGNRWYVFNPHKYTGIDGESKLKTFVLHPYVYEDGKFFSTEIDAHHFPNASVGELRMMNRYSQFSHEAVANSCGGYFTAKEVGDSTTVDVTNDYIQALLGSWKVKKVANVGLETALLADLSENVLRNYHTYESMTVDGSETCTREWQAYQDIIESKIQDVLNGYRQSGYEEEYIEDIEPEVRKVFQSFAGAVSHDGRYPIPYSGKNIWGTEGIPQDTEYVFKISFDTSKEVARDSTKFLAAMDALINAGNEWGEDEAPEPGEDLTPYQQARLNLFYDRYFTRTGHTYYAEKKPGSAKASIELGSPWALTTFCDRNGETCKGYDEADAEKNPFYAEIESEESNPGAPNSKFIKSISWKAYDYDTFRFLIDELIDFDLLTSIDFNASYAPDLNLVANDINYEMTPVISYFDTVEYSEDVPYQILNPSTISSGDLYDYAGRSALIHTELGTFGSSSSPTSSYYEVSGEFSTETDDIAQYDGDKLMVDTKSISGLQKGVKYNVNVQFSYVDDSRRRGFFDGDKIYKGGDDLRRSIAYQSFNSDGWKVKASEYKWGELILASKPSKPRSLERYENTINWLRPTDEGLGELVGGRGKIDNYVYIKNYIVEVTNRDTGKVVYSKEINNNTKENQSFTLPENVLADDNINYAVKVYAVNSIGKSEAALLNVDKVAKPAVEVTKTSDKEVYVASDTVVFTDTVKNTGNVDLTNVVLAEDLKGIYTPANNITIDGIKAKIAKIEVGKSVSVKYSVKAKLAEEGVLDSTVYVTSSEGAEGNANKKVQVKDELVPQISVEKTGPEKVKIGTDTTYTDKITNIGAVDLTEVTLSENLEGTFVESDKFTVNGNKAVLKDALKVGESANIDFKVKVTEDKFEDNKLTSTVVATTKEGATDEATVVSKVNVPAIKVSTTPLKNTYFDGDEVVYSESVRNTGNVDLTDVVVTESIKGKFQSDVGIVNGDVLKISKIRVGETVSFVYTAKASTGTLSKKLVAEAAEGVKDEATAKISLYAPTVTVSKVADIETFKKGDKVTYTSVVKNTGNCPLTNVVISENMYGTFAGDIKGEGTVYTLDTLGVGEFKTYTYTTDSSLYTIKDSKATSKVYVTSAEGAKADANVTLTEVPEVVTVEKPDYTVTKVANVKSCYPEDMVVFTTTIENTGDVDIPNLVITEDLKGTFSGIEGKDGIAKRELLKVGESISYKYTVKVEDTQYGNGYFSSNVLVEADKGAPKTANAIVGVLKKDKNSITVVKTAEKPSYTLGDVLVFNNRVTNTGETVLHNVTFDEDLESINPIPVIESIEPGQSMTVVLRVDSAKLGITEDTTVSSTVNVSCDEGATANDTAETEVKMPVVNTPDEPKPADEPKVSVTKSADKVEYTKGDKVVYTSVVRNEGNTPLEEVTIVEDLKGTFAFSGHEEEGSTLEIGNLDIGESFAYTYTVDTNKVVLDGIELHSIVNVFTNRNAKANAKVDVVVKEKPMVDPDPILPDPTISVEAKKVPEKPEFKYGDVIVVIDTVTNDGDIILHNVKITENLPGVFEDTDYNEYTVPTLKPGEKIELKFIVDTNTIDDPSPIISKMKVTTDEGAEAEAECEIVIDGPGIGLSANKTPDKPKYDYGDVVTTIDTVINTSDITLHNVKITENLPGVFEGEEGNTIIIPEMKPGERVTIKFIVDTNSIDDPSPITSKMKVTCDEGANAEADCTIIIDGPALGVNVKKVADKPEITIGDVITFTDTVENTSVVTLHNVKVKENLPGVFVGEKGNEVIIPELKPGEKVELKFSVDTSKLEVPDTKKIISKVTVTSDEGATGEAECDVSVKDPYVETPTEPTPTKPTPSESTPSNPTVTTNNVTPVSSPVITTPEITPVTTGSRTNTLLIVVLLAVMILSGGMAVMSYKKLNKKD